MTLRRTKRYQVATEGVRGDGTSRRKWLSRLGFWRFEVEVEVVQRPVREGNSPWYEPVRVETFVRFKIRYKDRVWTRDYLVPDRAYAIIITAKMKAIAIAQSIMARFLKREINTDKIRITVKRKEDN